jgi:cytochrome c553
MKPMPAALSDADMANVAASIPQQAKPGFAKNKDLASLGEKSPRQRHRSPDPDCSGCHSPNGAGIPAQYPRLAASCQTTPKRSLLFRSGARGSSPVMTDVGQAQRPRDQASDYVAGSLIGAPLVVAPGDLRP